MHLSFSIPFRTTKVVGIGRLEKGDASVCKGHALERKPSKAWARKIPALTRPITAVSVSIIANIPCTRRGENDCAIAQSKGIIRRNRLSGPTDDFVQQVAAKQDSAGREFTRDRRAAIPANRRLAKATIDSPTQCSPHFRRVRAAICSFLRAEMGGYRGRVTAEGLKVGMRPLEW